MTLGEGDWKRRITSLCNALVPFMAASSSFKARQIAILSSVALAAGSRCPSFLLFSFAPSVFASACIKCIKGRTNIYHETASPGEPPLRRVAPLLEEFSSPCVSFSLLPKTSDSIGQSKLGGRPDLPDQFAWPADKGRPLQNFLLQINFADTALFDETNPLPESGLLSFFYDLEHQPWCFRPRRPRRLPGEAIHRVKRLSRQIVFLTRNAHCPNARSYADQDYRYRTSVRGHTRV